MMVSFYAVLFPRGVLDEILSLIESVSEGFPSYSHCHATDTGNDLQASVQLTLMA